MTRYVRKLFTIPEEVADRLATLDNQSAFVVESIKLNWENRDAVRHLISQNKRIIELLEQSPAQTTQQSLPTNRVRELQSKISSYWVAFERDGRLWARNKVTGEELEESDMDFS